MQVDPSSLGPLLSVSLFSLVLLSRPAEAGSPSRALLSHKRHSWDWIGGEGLRRI